MNKTRFFGLLTIFCALLAVLILANPTEARAATVAIGTCGDDAKWYLTDDGTLTIYGSGAMDNWLSLSSVPWRSERSSIKKVVIRDEVTTIGKCAFYGCTNLTSVTIGSGVTAIGIESFAGCTKLQSVVIPASVTEIGTAAFADCGQLTLIKFEGSAPGFAPWRSASWRRKCRRRSCVWLALPALARPPLPIPSPGV